MCDSGYSAICKQSNSRSNCTFVQSDKKASLSADSKSTNRTSHWDNLYLRREASQTAVLSDSLDYIWRWLNFYPFYIKTDTSHIKLCGCAGWSRHTLSIYDIFTLYGLNKSTTLKGYYNFMLRLSYMHILDDLYMQ